MRSKTIFTIAIVMVLSLSACTEGGKTPLSSSGGDTLKFRYAANLSIIKYKDYTVAAIRNPWDTLKVLRSYVLVDKDKPIPDNLPDGALMRLPLSNAMVYSSVHCSLLKDIGALQSVGGICDIDYIKVPEILEACATGQVVNAGNGMNPDVEKIIELAPDAIMLSPFENSGGYGRFEKIGTPIVECADYMEVSALGRAEWMRFYGLLFGREREADSLFSVIEQRYNRLVEKVKDVKVRPTVLCEMKIGAAWYVPGGKSVTGKLYSDAGGHYAFDYIDNSGSVPLSFETVYDKAKDADVWLIKYNTAQDKTYRDLAADYAPYAGFKAYEHRKVYGCNTSRVSYYEDAPFHPDLLLEDIVKILHPSVMEDDSLRYFTNLEE